MSHNLFAERRSATRRRAFRIAAGLCVDCGKVPPVPGRRRCPACAESATARTMARARRRKQPCIALGLCPVCELRVAMPGVKICGVCSERQTSYKATLRARYRAEGRCVRCGHERDREDRALCQGCRTQNITLKQRIAA